MRLALAAFTLFFAACTNEPATLRTLKASGFTDVRITDSWWGCSQSDLYWTGFAATNPRGQRVEGVVCCGAFVKGCTVRF